MDFRCTTDKYDALYARWLENPGKLLDAASYEPGMRLLDLCGGTGAISREALRRGADPESLLLLDLNPRCPDPRVPSVVGDANRLGGIYQRQQPECHESFDIIVCRQAFNYIDFNTWPGKGTINWIHSLLKPNGLFVFNTFIHPRWSLKTYRHGERRFFEASGYFGRKVMHVQASPGLGMDVTSFHWYKEMDLRMLFSFYLDIQIMARGRSQTWVCTKRVWR